MPLMFGIVAGNAMQQHHTITAIIGASLLLFCIPLSFFVSKRFPFFASVLLGASIAMVGILLVFAQCKQVQPNFIGKQYQSGTPILATLTEPPLPKEKSWKANATVQLVKNKQQLQKVDGSIIIYLQKNDSAPLPAYGKTILFTKTLQPIINAGNPGGFDYKTFAARQGIFYQVFLKPGEYQILPGHAESHFQNWLYQCRDWVLRTIVHYIPGDAEKGVAQALLIGYRGDLDKTLVEQYANTGVVHIIAISGMHLGMIFGLLLLIFKPLGNSRHMRLLRMMLILSCIWLFTLLTGAAPSITRAAVMFSILAIGQHWRRNISVYNTLAAAAILLLVFDPYVLWNVGFQLSFTAVLSIAIFYSPILKWWSPGNKLLKHLWQMMAVTMAAQLLTLPLAVYHFHQFPMYFLIANLVAVPLSGLALYGIILLLAVSFWHTGATLIGILVSYSLAWLNAFIVWVSDLPFTTISHIQMSILQTAIMYGILACFCWWWFKKSSNALLAGVGFVALFFGLRSWQFYETEAQQKLLIYNVPQHTGIDIIAGHQSIFIGDTELTEAGFLQNFHLLPSRIHAQFEPNQQLLLPDKTNISFTWAGKKITLLRTQLDYKKSQPITTDILIVSGNPPGNPARLLPLIRCSQIVLDGSNSAGRIARWQHAADSLHLRLHSVSRQGAFVMEMGRQQSGPHIK